MKSQKKMTTREKAVIVYSLLFPETSREDLFRAAYDGSDEDFSRLKSTVTASYHWLNTKKVSEYREEVREQLKALNLLTV